MPDVFNLMQHAQSATSSSRTKGGTCLSTLTAEARAQSSLQDDEVVKHAVVFVVFYARLLMPLYAHRVRAAY